MHEKQVHLSNWLLLSQLILFAACDVVPYKNAKEIRPIAPIDTTTTIDTTAIVPQNVLIEDYTGHTCGNCPSAALDAKRLEGLYPGRVFIMGVHCSFFARPKNNANGSFKTDFRTPVGDALDAKFKVSSAGLPKGIVNRRRFGNSTLSILSSTEWEGKVSQILAEEPMGIKININPIFSITSRQLRVNADVLFQKEYSENLKMALYVTEDSIVSWQKDYSRPPLGLEEDFANYVHNHVLRTDLTPTSGTDVLNSGLVPANKRFLTSWTTTLAANVVSKKCHVLMIIFKADTDEIVQVFEKELTEN